MTAPDRFQRALEEEFGCGVGGPVEDGDASAFAERLRAGIHRPGQGPDRAWLEARAAEQAAPRRLPLRRVAAAAGLAVAAWWGVSVSGARPEAANDEVVAAASSIVRLERVDSGPVWAGGVCAVRVVVTDSSGSPRSTSLRANAWPLGDDHVEGSSLLERLQLGSVGYLADVEPSSSPQVVGTGLRTGLDGTAVVTWAMPATPGDWSLSVESDDGTLAHVGVQCQALAEVVWGWPEWEAEGAHVVTLDFAANAESLSEAEVLCVADGALRLSGPVRHAIAFVDGVARLEVPVVAHQPGEGRFAARIVAPNASWVIERTADVAAR